MSALSNEMRPQNLWVIARVAGLLIRIKLVQQIEYSYVIFDL